MANIVIWVGSAIALVGLVMVPLPGPGVPLIALGALTVLVGVVLQGRAAADELE